MKLMLLKKTNCEIKVFSSVRNEIKTAIGWRRCCNDDYGEDDEKMRK